MRWQTVVRDITPPIIMRKIKPTKGHGYIDCKTTVRKARAAGVSVHTYLHSVWDTNPHTIETFVSRMRSCVPLEQCKDILEIGAGAGLWLEPTQEIAKPDTYSVYELDADWSSYLTGTYKVRAHFADGRTLSSTADTSQDLIHSHYVFNYLPIVIAFSYFHEMFRVCRPRGYIVFDCFSDKDCGLEQVERWLNYNTTYQVLMPTAIVIELFNRNGFDLVSDKISFARPNELDTRYLIFQKR